MNKNRRFIFVLGLALVFFVAGAVFFYSLPEREVSLKRFDQLLPDQTLLFFSLNLEKKPEILSALSEELNHIRQTKIGSDLYRDQFGNETPEQLFERWKKIVIGRMFLEEKDKLEIEKNLHALQEIGFAIIGGEKNIDLGFIFYTAFQTTKEAKVSFESIRRTLIARNISVKESHSSEGALFAFHLSSEPNKNEGNYPLYALQTKRLVVFGTSPKDLEMLVGKALKETLAESSQYKDLYSEWDTLSGDSESALMEVYLANNRLYDLLKNLSEDSLALSRLFGVSPEEGERKASQLREVLEREGAVLQGRNASRIRVRGGPLQWKMCAYTEDLKTIEAYQSAAHGLNGIVLEVAPKETVLLFTTGARLLAQTINLSSSEPFIDLSDISPDLNEIIVRLEELRRFTFESIVGDVGAFIAIPPGTLVSSLPIGILFQLRDQEAARMYLTKVEDTVRSMGSNAGQQSSAQGILREETPGKLPLLRLTVSSNLQIVLGLIGEKTIFITPGGGEHIFLNQTFTEESIKKHQLDPLRVKNSASLGYLNTEPLLSALKPLAGQLLFQGKYRSEDIDELEGVLRYKINMFSTVSIKKDRFVCSSYEVIANKPQ